MHGLAGDCVENLPFNVTRPPVEPDWEGREAMCFDQLGGERIEAFKKTESL